MGSISYRVGPLNLNVSFKDLEKFYKVWKDNMKKADQIEKEEEKKGEKERIAKSPAVVAPARHQQVIVEKFSPAPVGPSVVRAQIIEGELVSQEEENTEYDDIEIIETKDGTRVAVVKKVAEVPKEESRFVDLYAIPQEVSKIS